MKRLFSHIWLAVTLAVALLWAACSSGGATIERPDGFPDAFPVYPGATLTHALAEPTGSFAASWESSDSSADVVAFYQARLGPRFVLEQESEFLETRQLVVEDTTGEFGRGVVTVSEGDAGTTIGVSIGLPSIQPEPSDAATPAPTEAPPAVDLPVGYPADLVPVIDQGTVIGAEVVSDDNTEIFGVTVLTSQTPEQAAEFYTTELDAAGLQFEAEAEGTEQVVRFEGSGIRGGITASSDGPYSGQTIVDIYIERTGAQPTKVSTS